MCFSYVPVLLSCSFFFNDTATPQIYTLSLHDALPILELFERERTLELLQPKIELLARSLAHRVASQQFRSEEHTSELQSHSDLVCRLLLEKKKNNTKGRSTQREPRRLHPTLQRQHLES